MNKSLLEIASEIVQTQAGSASMTAAEIASSLRAVFITLQEMQKSEAAGTGLAEVMPEGTEEPAPKAINPQDSIQQDKVICLECGAEMRQLSSKHLASHNMDQKAYRKKYGFATKTPLSAKSVTKARIRAAKKRGLPENLKTFIEQRRQKKAQAAGEVVETPKPRTRLRKKKTV